MEIHEFLLSVGAYGSICGFMFWLLKRYIDKRDARKEEREKNTERLMLMMMQTGRATNVLAEATARAVQRIPDAHCNGDMKKALEDAARIQNEEKDFLMDQGIQHIFEN